MKSREARLRFCEVQLPPRHPFLAVVLALGFAARKTTAFVQPHLLDHRWTTSGTAGALQSQVL